MTSKHRDHDASNSEACPPVTDDMPRCIRPPPNRFACLDGLRGWAALTVVVHHATVANDFALYSGDPKDSRGAWDVWLSGHPFFPLAPVGNTAVCLFFALSGFVLAHAYARSAQSWPALLVRRFVRLGLPMLAGCLFGWGLLAAGMMNNQAAARLTHSWWLASQYGQTPDLGAAVAEPLLILLGHTPTFQTSYDSALWTMPIEAIGSVLVLGVVALARRRGARGLRRAGWAFAILAAVAATSYLGLVAFGAALRLLRHAPDSAAARQPTWRTAALLACGAFLGTVPFSAVKLPIYTWLLRAMTWPTLLPWPHTPETLCHAIGAAVLLWAVLHADALQILLSGPASRWLGRISFPLYILHIPLLMVVLTDTLLLAQRAGAGPIAASLASTAVFCAASVTLAAVAAPVIEGGALGVSAWIGAASDRLIRRLSPRRIMAPQPEDP